MPTATATDTLASLSRLNQTYIDCVVTADADRFATILAPDFLCSASDGMLLDRDAFLTMTRATPPLQRMDIDDVRIRVFGDVAIIHARTSYILGNGREGAGRYTDIWALRDGAWLAVAAHVTRL